MIYKVITKSSQKLNLRESPSTSSKIVGYLLKDNAYMADRLNVDGTWAHFYYGENGAEGWASMEYLQVADMPDDKYSITFTREELEGMRDYIDELLKGSD